DVGRSGKVEPSGLALAGRRLASRPLFCRSACAPVGQELDRAVERDPLGIVARAEARIRLPIRDIRPEAAGLDDDRLAGCRIVPDLLQRPRRLALPPALARLREERQRLVERDREDLLLGLERPRFLALLHVGAVPPV